MDIKDIMSHVDHTLLKQDATWEDIKIICDDACNYGTASVCIPTAFVKTASEYLGKKMPVCTVIGFPNGYYTSATKCFETEDALKNGAKEIDMVIHIGALKEKRYNDILQEIRSIKEICNKNILKVIIETCLLTDEEKITMCKIVGEAGADYIKTSTGFSSGGATFDDIRLFKKHVPTGLLIKAAGGIKTFDDAREFISLGADRLGTSRLVSILKQEKATQQY